MIASPKAPSANWYNVISSAINQADLHLQQAPPVGIVSGAALPLEADLLSRESKLLPRCLKDPALVIANLDELASFVGDLNPVLGTYYTDLPQVKAIGNEDLSLNIFSIIEVLNELASKASAVAWIPVQKRSPMIGKKPHDRQEARINSHSVHHCRYS